MRLLKELLKTAYVARSIGWQCFKYKLSFWTTSICQVRPKDVREKINLRTRTSDYLVFEQIFTYKAYEMKTNINPNIIIDCGANIGLTSIYFSNKYPNSKIIAIEPERSNYEMMLKNTQNYSNIVCLQKGIWKKSCFLEIMDESVSNWEFMVKETDAKTDISAISIPDLIKEYEISQIDILKIDIEGSEKEIFEDHPEAWLPFVNILIVELHDRYKEGCSQALFKSLVPYHYSVDIKGDNLFIHFHHKRKL